MEDQLTLYNNSFRILAAFPNAVFDEHGDQEENTFEKLKGRAAVPSHHLLKVESFSLLSKAPIEKYSSEFEAGGYKWNLSIYPNGDKNKDGQGYISIYLEISSISSLPAGWEVNAIFNFFVFDQLRDKYVGPQDGTVWRFHCLKKQRGVVKFIDLETFNNPSNGYLVNDACSFGVEVFIVKSASKAESLSMINNPPTHKYYWKNDASEIDGSSYITEFVAGDYRWMVGFCPSGFSDDDTSIALFLKLDPSTLRTGTKLFVRYTFRVMDRKKGNHVERSGSTPVSSGAIGFWNFMSQTKFKDPENGYVADGTFLIVIEIQVLGLVTWE